LRNTLIFILYNGNALAAVQRYAEGYPNRRVPSRQTFINVDQRLRKTSSVLPKNQLMGRGRAEGLAAVEEEILERVEEDPMISTRQLDREVGLSHWTVWRTLQENLLHSYHIQRVQSLSPNDFAHRRRFFRWLQRKITENPLFHATILIMSDKCCFTRDGILNYHNTYHWADANPHAICYFF
jgi:hypothetical protein